MQDSGIAIYDAAWKRVEPELGTAATVLSDETFKKVEEGQYCIFHGLLIFRAVLDDYFKKKSYCNFHLSENVFFPFPLVMLVKKTLPRKFKEKLNIG